jgi:hypothetical protein
VFGLARHPFARVCDGDLFWESSARSAARRSAFDLMRNGKGIWLSGPPGSGRSALLGRLAEDLAAEGRPVLQAELSVSPSAEAFLAGLLDVVAEHPVAAGAGVLSVARELYARLLEAWCARGPIPCFPGPVSASPDVVAELEILGGLRLVGGPVVVLGLAGAGESPLPTLHTVRLPPPSAFDLRQMLAHRLSACGGAGLLAPEVLERIGERAGGFEEALTLGRRALSRAAFRLGLQGAGRVAVPREETPTSLFDPAELDEVARLLDSLGPEAPAS